MQMIPEIIYVTGGASKNTAIVQILADIFQAEVQRMEISSSVALGASLKQHSMD